MKIVNLVCSGSLNQIINLAELSNVGLIEYNPKKYHGGYIKTCDYPITLYRTGKYIITGLKSLEEMDKTFDQMKELLSKHLDVSMIGDPRISNIVCTSDYGCPIKLDNLYIRLSREGFDVTYEPESFPGLILRTEDGSFNVFSSGKYIILGGKNLNDAERMECYFNNLMCNNS